MIIDELVTILGLKADPKAAREAGLLKSALGGITNIALAVGAALAAAATAVQAYAFRQVEGIAEAKRFADSLDLSYTRLQELEFAARSTGGSAEDLRGDLERLTKSMSSPIPGEYNQTLYMLGISARDASGKMRSADEVLLSIADKLAGMSKQRQLQFADRLGLSRTSLRLIQEGRDGIAALSGEARSLGVVLDSGTGDQAVRAQRALEGLRAAVAATGTTLAAALLPGLESGVKALGAWIGKNRELIASGLRQFVEGVAGGFGIVADGVGLLVAGIKKLIGPVEFLNRHFDATQLIAVAVAGALVALVAAAAYAAAPFLAIAAAVGAVVLVVEDLYTYFRGGPSLIGGWVDAFKAAYPNLAQVIGSIGKLITWLAGLGADLAKGAFAKFVADLSNKLQALEKIVGGVLTAFDKLAAFLSMPGVGAAVGAMLPGVGGLVQAHVAASAAVPAGVMAEASRNGRASGNSGPLVGTLNINGAGDPMAVGDAVSRSLGLGESVQSITPGMTGPGVY